MTVTVFMMKMPKPYFYEFTEKRRAWKSVRSISLAVHALEHIGFSIPHHILLYIDYYPYGILWGVTFLVSGLFRTMVI